MKSAWNRERLWAVRLMAGHACHRASLRVGAALLPCLPPRMQNRMAEEAFAWIGPRLQPHRHTRALGALQQLGHKSSAATRLAARFLATSWIRQARFHRLRHLPFPAQQDVLRAMRWHDPLALWAAAAGRRRVICVLPSGDMELAMAALLDRPGAPSHYFISTYHRQGSPRHRVLAALQRQGHRLDIGQSGQSGQAWRHLRRGASVVTKLDPWSGDGREPGPLRLARLAQVPVLLLGHRCDDSEAGTLHVLGEFGAESMAGGAASLRAAALAFLATAPHDWADLDR
ncbi:hypothetical protein [Stenotrophomonas maltophilia]|uniref:hypothetical protein n=1 Tax=Stenotrophomonas maltophilia TaxID=40324 RepID=UPI0013127E91|nr:hypothetical protein PGKDCPLP_00351 [Stenotrophomonas maltophilia]